MKIKAVTFNLRMENISDKRNYFFNRAPLVLKKIRSEKPDIIGFQEATDRIYEWLRANLYEYTIVGTGRNMDFTGEACPVAFLKDRFELYSLDQFWLSPTPGIPGSRYEDQSVCPRVCTACRIRKKGTSDIIAFYNTHLDHIGETARLLGIKQVLERIERDNSEFPCHVVLTGDMNASPDESSIAVATSYACGINGGYLKDVSSAVTMSYHGYKGYFSEHANDFVQKIDYIFTDEACESSCPELWDCCEDGVFLSDHFPVSVLIDTDGCSQEKK